MVQKMNKLNGSDDYYISPKSLLSIAELAEMFQVSRPVLMEWVAEGKFPPPLAISKRKKLFLYQDILDYINDRKKGIDRTYAPRQMKHITKNDKF